jgi:hypothetical protein
MVMANSTPKLDSTSITEARKTRKDSVRITVVITRGRPTVIRLARIASA